MKTASLMLALLLVAVSHQTTRAGSISHLPGGMKCAEILNNGKLWCVFTIEIGTITSQTVKGVKKLLDYKKAANYELLGSMVFLNSPGGSVHAAFDIGRLVRSESLPVTIERGSRCVSACVFVLAAAQRRTIHGAVGIHRPFLEYGEPNAASSKSADQIAQEYENLLQDMRVYLHEMGVLERVADEMLRISPNNVRYLTRAEMDAYNLGEGPAKPDAQKLVVSREVLATKAADAYGITRQEYIRRDALIERTCKLSIYERPGEPPVFSKYGRTQEELRRPPEEQLLNDIKLEEAEWSHCYKMIMTYGW